MRKKEEITLGENSKYHQPFNITGFTFCILFLSFSHIGKRYIRTTSNLRISRLPESLDFCLYNVFFSSFIFWPASVTLLSSVSCHFQSWPTFTLYQVAIIDFCLDFRKCFFFNKEKKKSNEEWAISGSLLFSGKWF